MATATAKVSITDTEASQKYLHVFGTVAISAAADTYATGGITLDFTGHDEIKSSSIPLAVYLQSQKSPNSGWTYLYNPGTTQANGKLQIFGGGATANNPASELAAGQAMTTEFADVIFFEALFKFGV